MSIGLLCWSGLAAGAQCSNVGDDVLPAWGGNWHRVGDLLADHQRADPVRNRYVIEDGKDGWISRLCLAMSNPSYASTNAFPLYVAVTHGVDVREREDGVVVLRPEPEHFGGPLQPARPLGELLGPLPPWLHIRKGCLNLGREYPAKAPKVAKMDNGEPYMSSEARALDVLAELAKHGSSFRYHFGDGYSASVCVIGSFPLTQKAVLGVLRHFGVQVEHGSDGTVSLSKALEDAQ